MGGVKSTAFLRVLGVSVAYERSPVLHGLDFEVKRGDVVVILGPNGVGKTTLLRTIARTMRPKIGTVLLDDTDISHLPNKTLMRQITVLPQVVNTHFNLTVLDIVAMGRTPHLSPLSTFSLHDQKLVQEAMEITDTWQLRDRLFTEISGGEQRRVLFAKAIAQQPKLLLLDEPTSNLDLHYQMQLLELIRQLNKKLEFTVIAVMHDLNLAAMFGEKFILMSNGKIFAMGFADEVLTSQNIQKVYGVHVAITHNPFNGKPIFVPSERNIVFKSNLKVHVVCGGGTGAEVMRELVYTGCKVTAGVLNRGDSDYATCHLLGIPVVEEQPFMPISDDALQRNQKFIREADVVILTDVPFGWGNIANLKAILESANNLVVVFKPDTIAQRDFTGGQTVKLLQAIFSQKRTVSVQEKTELTDLLMVELVNESGFDI